MKIILAIVLLVGTTNGNPVYQSFTAEYDTKENCERALKVFVKTYNPKHGHSINRIECLFFGKRPVKGDDK